MIDHLEEALGAELTNRQLLSHPFYRRWEAGELRQYELINYVEQYRHFEKMLPVFLQNLSEQLPEGPSRDSVIANLSDEVSQPSHLELFEIFALSLQAGHSEISPAMLHLVKSYSRLLQLGGASSLAGLWAYESQGAAIAESKAEGLMKHYGFERHAISFWLVHGSIEGDHANWTFEGLKSLNPNIVEVKAAVRLIAEAWWFFLDERESFAA